MQYGYPLKSTGDMVVFFMTDACDMGFLFIFDMQPSIYIYMGPSLSLPPQSRAPKVCQNGAKDQSAHSETKIVYNKITMLIEKVRSQSLL